MSTTDPSHLERLARINESNRSMSSRLPNFSNLNFTVTGAQKKALFFVAITAIAGSLLLLVNAQARPTGEVITSEPTTSQQVTTNPVLVVDVQGEVINPGLYELPLGSRVGDAIKAAGGVRKGSDSSSVNLARFLEDGEQIYVSEVGAVSATGGGSAVAGKLNINRASENELDALPGVGPVLASRITAYRNENGNFSSVDELRKVSGIGPAKFSELRDFVTV